MTSPQPDRDPRSSKCEGRTVRRHHRKCAKRGACHKGRGALAESLEDFAVSMCLVGFRIRRGRHGRGLTTTQALGDLMTHCICGPATLTAIALQRRVAKRLRLPLGQVQVQVASPSPGEVAVQINARVLASRLLALEEEMRQDLPSSSAIHVESLTTTS